MLRDAPSKLDHVAVVDSLGGDRGIAAARVRRGHGPLRRAAPDAIEDLEALRDADRFRFANVLRPGSRSTGRAASPTTDRTAAG